VKTSPDNIEADLESASDLPITAIRVMCRGINTNVPNDAKVTQAFDDLITSKATARVASLKRARKISLDDL
jgi:hypothetical protein